KLHLDGVLGELAGIDIQVAQLRNTGQLVVHVGQFRNGLIDNGDLLMQRAVQRPKQRDAAAEGEERLAKAGEKTLGIRQGKGGRSIMQSLVVDSAAECRLPFDVRK